jgi:hypothetical protein
LPLALLDAVDERARATERTRAATIRALLGEALADDAGSPVGPSGVDVAQIRRSLARSPAERLRHNTVAVHRIRRLQGGDSSSGIRPDLP